MARSSSIIYKIIFFIILSLGFYTLSVYHYLLFHTLVELFSIIIAYGIFVFAWNSRKFIDNDYLLFIGISYFFIATLDLFHTFSYHGMAIFDDYSSDLGIQFWIVTRYFESISFLIAPLFFTRRLNIPFIFTTHSLLFITILIAIFGNLFPACYNEEIGLTAFKINSEYLIISFLLISLFVLYKKRNEFDGNMVSLLMASLVLTALSEMVFTLYADIYDSLNFLGHWLKVISFYLIYIAIIKTGFTKPYSLLFKNLQEKEKSLQHAKEIAEKAKEAAEKANNAKSIFLTSMSHELRTPLNSILGYVQILQRHSTINQQQQRGLDVIQQSGQHLLNLINDILDLAKIESGKTELYQINFDLHLLLKNVKDIISVRAEQKGIDFNLELIGVLPNYIRGDERRLQQVLLNLLGNAVKFTDEGHVTLQVYFEQTTSTFCFIIQDTGVGISPEHLSIIFQPFQQVGDQNKKIQGTGLGLIISKDLISLMGGQLNVTSQLNIGTKFWFELALPIVKNNLVHEEIVEKKITGIKDLTPKILIVDDADHNREILINLLSPIGFDCQQAKNGKTALEIALKYKPDVIITDLVMPVLDGFELIRKIRQMPIIKDTIIIANSASIYGEDKMKGADMNVNSFISKPIQAEKLYSQLQQLLHLTWIYETNTDTHSEKNIDEMILPSPTTLTTLHKLALMGDINGLKTQVSFLIKSDGKYKPFVIKMQYFITNYKMKELKFWLTQISK